MIASLMHRITSLSKENRHMLMLFWIYEFANIITSIFIGAYIFLEVQSIILLGAYVLIRFAGGFLGFVVLGYLFSLWQRSLRNGYVISFTFFFVGFVWLALMSDTLLGMLVFALLNGLALGVFWLTNHSYEMLYTKNNNGERDFYSSVEQGGVQVLSIVAPFIGTLLALLADNVFQLSTLSLLFWFIPCIFLVSLPFLFSMPDFVPPRLSLRKPLRQYRTEERSVYVYFFLTFVTEFMVLIKTIFSVLALGALVAIGAWQTAIAIVAFLVIMFLANKRYQGNRTAILGISLLGIFGSLVLLFFVPTSVYFYLAFSLLLVVLQPIYRVSEHAIDLYSMDILARRRSSFYAGMLLREAILFIGRAVAMLGVMVIALYVTDLMVMALVIVVLYIVFSSVRFFYARKVNSLIEKN